MSEEMKDQATPGKEPQVGESDSGSNHNSTHLEPGMTAESRLDLARAGRTRAENERQNIANEILLSTKDVCQKLISEGESTLAKARNLETKAEQKRLEALTELEYAKSTREEAVVYAAKVVAEANQESKEADERAATLRQEADNYAKKVKAEATQQARETDVRAAALRQEADNYAETVKSEAKQQGEEADKHAASVKETADAYAEAVISQAKNHAERVEEQAPTVLREADAYSAAVIAESQQQAEDIVELARAAAEQEAAGIRQRRQDEVGKALAEAEMAQAAVQQELEAQQIYTESARVTVESLEVLVQIRAKLAEYSFYPESDPIPESADDDQHLVEQPVESPPLDSGPGDSPLGNLSDDQLKAWLD